MFGNIRIERRSLPVLDRPLSERNPPPTESPTMASVAPSRLATLNKLRCSIFQTAYNPTSVRTGAKYLRARLRGPSMLNYYPVELSVPEARKMLPKFEIVDKAEQERLEDVNAFKARGKGTPRKARNKGAYQCTAREVFLNPFSQTRVAGRRGDDRHRVSGAFHVTPSPPTWRVMVSILAVRRSGLTRDYFAVRTRSHKMALHVFTLVSQFGTQTLVQIKDTISYRLRAKITIQLRLQLRMLNSKSLREWAIQRNVKNLTILVVRIRRAMHLQSIHLHRLRRRADTQEADSRHIHA